MESTFIIEKSVVIVVVFALTMLIIGVILFIAGFLGELVSRNGGDRNAYNIAQRLGWE